MNQINTSEATVVTEVLSRKIAFFSIIAVILVVYCHVPNCAQVNVIYYIERLIQEEVGQIAVPFFFCVSGFMVARHTNESSWWRKESQKRVRSVLIPYILWCTINAAYSFVVTLSANFFHQTDLMRNMDIAPFFHIYGLDPRMLPLVGPLWYLRELLVFLLPLPIFVRIIKKSVLSGKILLVFLVIMQIAIGLVEGASPSQFFRFFLSFGSMFYYCLGIYLWHYPASINKTWGYVAFLLGASLMLTPSATMILHFGYPTVIRVMVHIGAVLFFLVGLWSVMPVVHLPKFLNAVSFPIYLLHMMCLNGIALVCKNLFPYVFSSSAGFFVLGAVVVIMSIIVCLLMRKLFPRISGILFGGR